MANTRKGLPDIRTISGKADQAAFVPFKAYMRLFCLEMELFRRGKEKESAIQRVNNINARFEQIEAEKAALSNALDQENRGATADTRSIESRQAHRRRMQGFKIKY